MFKYVNPTLSLIQAKAELNTEAGNKDIHRLVRIAEKYELPIEKDDPAELSALCNVRYELSQGTLRTKEDVQAFFIRHRDEHRETLLIQEMQRRLKAGESMELH